ncbi:hypothetical protein N9H39_07375 [Gammaproteobacteria bacterium]|nr:hypothetical protein [Gammaproteobacteria bacterium]
MYAVKAVFNPWTIEVSASGDIKWLPITEMTRNLAQENHTTGGVNAYQSGSGTFSQFFQLNFGHGVSVGVFGDSQHHNKALICKIQIKDNKVKCIFVRFPARRWTI